MTHKLTALIADDESLAREYLESILQENADIEIVSICKNGYEAIQDITEHQPDLLFLDIHMPNINGFDVVKAIQADIMPLIVFVTAFSQYAVDAFNAEAIDYILKPIDEKRVNRAVERALIKQQNQRSGEQLKALMLQLTERALTPAVNTSSLDNTQQLNNIKQSASLNQVQSPGKNLTVRESGIELEIDYQVIDWIDAAGDYMCVHAKGKTYVLRSTLIQLMAELPETLFARVHRSTLVNVNSISKVYSDPKGAHYFLLKNNKKIRVSRSYQHVVKAFLEP